MSKKSGGKKKGRTYKATMSAIDEQCEHSTAYQAKQHLSKAWVKQQRRRQKRGY